MATNLVTIDMHAVEVLAEKLGRLDGNMLKRVVVDSLNSVVDAGYDLSRNRMSAGINMPDQAIAEKMLTTHATPSQLRAVITALGEQRGLSHFNPVQLVQPAKGAARGDPARGIPSGHKSAGVGVSVTRGSIKKIKDSRIFIAPNIRDSEGNPFVMRRLQGRTGTGKTRMQRVLGPAVYQLLAHQLPAIVPEAEEALVQELLDNIDREIVDGLT